VLSLEVVLPTGDLIRLGSARLDSPGMICWAFCGLGRHLALVTEITVRLMRLPETTKTLLAIFDTLDDTTETVAAITSGGITRRLARCWMAGRCERRGIRPPGFRLTAPRCC